MLLNKSNCLLLGRRQSCCVVVGLLAKMKRTSPFDTPQQLKQQKTTKRKYNIAWQNHGKEVKGLPPLMYLDGPDVPASEKIASLDMDNTLITTQSGKVFPTGPSDWKLWSSKVKTKLNILRDDGFKIVIFTNQAGLEKKKTSPDDIKKKAAAIMDELGFPFQMFVATGENVYRKPGTEMWTFMTKKCNGGKKVDMDESVYVGDAAGRVKGWSTGKKKDFSCSDRKFAANVGVKFQTPEEFFNGDKPCTKFEWGSVDPKSVLKSSKSEDYSSLASSSVEMVILVGLPAAGKSTFAKTYLEPKGYEVVNRDTLKTQPKCLSTCEDALKNKKSVVVDNTNPSKESRKCFIDIAKKHNVKVRCFHLDLPKELCEHMNMFRQTQSAGVQRRVPAVGFNMFKSKFEAPDMSEGFTEIKKIEFVPKFKVDADKELFTQWT